MNNEQSTVQQLQDMLQSKNQFDIMEYWHKFWRRKWLVLGISVVITFGAAIYALMFIRPIYEVNATIAIESTSVLNNTLGGVSTRVTTNLDRSRILRKVFSADYLLQLADELDFQNNEEIFASAKSYQNSAHWLTDEDALQRATLAYLRKKFDISVTSRGDQFHVAVRDTSPVVAFKMVDTMTKIFVNQSRQNDLRGIRDVKEFSEEQLAIYKDKMDEAAQKLQEFNERMATSRGANITLDDVTLKNLTNLKDETAQIIDDRAKRLALLENRIPNNIIKGLSDELGEFDQLEQQVLEKQDDYRRLLTNNGKTSSELQLNNELNLLRLESNRVIEKAIDRAYPKLSLEQYNYLVEYTLGNFDLFILNSRFDVITGVLENTIKSAAAKPALDLELRKLEDEYEQHRRTYYVFLDKSQGTQIEEAIQNSDAEYKYQLIAQAQMPIYPVAGNKKKAVLIAFVLSLMVGIGIVVLLEFLDQTIRSEKDVQNVTGLPIMGTIPKMEQPFDVHYASISNNPVIASQPSNGRSTVREDQQIVYQNNPNSATNGLDLQGLENPFFS